MDDSTLLLLVAARCDNETLEKLYKCGLGEAISKFSTNDHFWYLRVQQMYAVPILWEVGEWRQAYYNLLSGIVRVECLTSMRVLLQTGYDSYRESATDLIVICSGGNLEVARLFISRSWVNLTEEIIYSAVSTAVNQGHLDILKLLYEEYAHIDIATCSTMLLKDSIRGGHAAVLKYLLKDCKADPSGTSTYMIQDVCDYGHLEVLRLLIEDTRINRCQFTTGALDNACKRGHIEIVKLLIKKADLDPSTDNHRVFLSACKEGRTRVVLFLLKDKRTNPGGGCNKAIRYAAENGHYEVVKILMTYKKVNPSVDKCAAFRYACKNGHADCAKYLLRDKRVDPGLNNNHALRYAVQGKRVEVVKMLLELSSLDPSGIMYHLLELSCKIGAIDILDILIRDRRVEPLLIPRHLLVPCIHVLKSKLDDRYVGCMMLNTIYRGENISTETIVMQIQQPVNTYSSLFQRVIIKRSDSIDTLRWIIRERLEELSEPARTIGDKIVIHTSKEFTAYRAFLLLCKGSDYRSILKRLRAEDGVTSEGIVLAARLMGAHLGGQGIDIDW